MRTSFVLALLSWSAILNAANPDDVQFNLRLTKNPPVFRAGESIEFELSYTSTADNKYQGSFETPTPELWGNNVRVAPLDGVLDLQKLRPSAFAGSILSGIGNLSPTPVTQNADLVDWYRFQKPGHYTLVVTSHAISRLQSAREGGGLEPLTLESNVVEFDVLPPDDSWTTQELNQVLVDLTSAMPEVHARALHHLMRLDTAVTARKLVELYLISADGVPELYLLASALRESSHDDIIVPLLEASLSDAAITPPSDVASLLAELEVRRDKEKHKTYDQYLAEASARVLMSMGQRSGPARARALYQLWNTAESQSTQRSAAPDNLSRLRFELLGVIADLTPTQRVQFLSVNWEKMHRDALLPLIESLVDDPNYSPEAFRRWCDGWPADCGDAIVLRAMRPDSNLPPFVILMIAERARPDLDQKFKIIFNELETDPEFRLVKRTAALLLRVGSRNLAPAVEQFLSDSNEKQIRDCDSRAYLIGYLVRVAQQAGSSRLSAELNDSSRVCGGQVLRTLNSAYKSGKIAPVTVEALRSPSLKAAATAALYLGENGPVEAEDALWRRLDDLWAAWSDRRKELDVVSFGDGLAQQTANLEQSLVSALIRGSAWSLGTGEIQRIREGCLTARCRDIADGKMYLNL